MKFPEKMYSNAPHKNKRLLQFFFLIHILKVIIEISLLMKNDQYILIDYLQIGTTMEAISANWAIIAYNSTLHKQYWTQQE
jgi:hypothetical protein